MSGSVNKVILIATCGKDPEIRSTADGKEIANLSVVTNNSWRDKATGEKRERSDWHRCSVFNEHLVKVCKDYVKKGSKLYLEGSLQTREYEKDGVKKYTTEVVLNNFGSVLVMLDSRKEVDARSAAKADGYVGDAASVADGSRVADDSIPY